MTDNLKITQPEDPKKVNMNQQWELEYWSKEFGVLIAKLKAAVNEVGAMVIDVRKCLGR